MQTNFATKTTTYHGQFMISFDKKKLTEQVLSAEKGFEKVRQLISFPLMEDALASQWRSALIRACVGLQKTSTPPGFTHNLDNLLTSINQYADLIKNRQPSISIDLLCAWADLLKEPVNINESCLAWIEWINSPPCMNLSPIYRALVAVYYLHRCHPFGAYQSTLNMVLLTFLLRCAGFDDAAEGLSYHFCQDKEQLSDVFKRTQRSQHQPCFQTSWMLHYFGAMQSFMDDTQHRIDKIYQKALFNQVKLTHQFNERQKAIIEHLEINLDLRHKKALYHSSFMRALYMKQSKRTLERDFK